ncbi:hypothetical protein V8E53_004867 [Lactarius tabidus]
MDDINITPSPTDEIPETDSFIYNPSFASSESIASYKTERSVNSRKSRYNALPRHKYAGIGLSNVIVTLGSGAPKVVSGQRLGGSIPHVDAGPSQAAVLNAILIDSEASADARGQFATELKPKFTTLVEYMYNFKTGQAPASIIHNTGRAEELLRDMNFIYPEPRTSRDPYRHPIIQRVIDTTWFCDEADIGAVDHENFSPMPIPIIAITLTVIEWCIGEWSGGTRRDSNWDRAKLQTVYGSHVSSLCEFPAHSSASLYQLQCDLLRNAREHAGVIESTNDPRVIDKDSTREERGEQLLRDSDARELVCENAALIRSGPGDSELVKERTILETGVKVGLESKSDLPMPLQASEYPNTLAAGLPLDTSGVLTCRLMHFKFLACQRPSVQEERGDQLLDFARQLARENEDMISPSDLEIIRGRITLVSEIKIELAPMRGLPRYLHAREYHKSSKGTLKFVKTVTNRARDAALGQNSAFPVHDTESKQRPGGLTPHVDAVPLQVTVQDPIPIDSESSGETTNISKQLGAEMKPKVTILVENMYNFKTSQALTSISYNARRAQGLLKQMNFIYPEPRTGRDPYRHPIIQRVIDTTWFRDKDDIGVVDHEHFSPMPIPIIALTLMVIECCIDEWSSGTRKDSGWDDAKLQTVYDSHVSSLLDFQAHSPASNRDLLYQLQCDLLRNAW